MRIYIGADHNGFDLKQDLVAMLNKAGYQAVDEGDAQLNPDDDFPQFAAKTVQALQADTDPDVKAILICGSGQGMCMAANRFRGIRASLVWDLPEARMSRNDDDSNVLCLPARVLKQNDAEAIVMAWLNTPFAGAPRFKRRIQQMDNL
ncbi:MAG TPA: RpiB/LacA/LacB family sugar-phosphate isomerase [Candidatus Saccharimonadales bacterium]|jgi:ribose 5-phosphate isomerase B|nr:RpiB/LacA/LacB family sugar-phosphate isomerase [Candidatus Saccharimonadales bacterium]